MLYAAPNECTIGFQRHSSSNVGKNKITPRDGTPIPLVSNWMSSMSWVLEAAEEKDTVMVEIYC